MNASDDALLWQGVSEENVRKAADLSTALKEELSDYYKLLKGDGKKKDIYLSEAIKAAQAVSDNAEATEAQQTEAITALAKAMKALIDFIEKLKP